jgi:hypothetical protein
MFHHLPIRSTEAPETDRFQADAVRVAVLPAQAVKRLVKPLACLSPAVWKAST